MSAWLLAAIATPLVLAALLLARATRAAALRLAPWAALPALALALRAEPGLQTEVPWLLLGARFGVDDPGRAFLLFTALLWVTAGLSARSYLAADRHRARFTAFFLVTAAGNLGLILAQDMASFYLFFALMTFSAYGLIVHTGSSEARRAGRVYLVMAVLGEAALLAGLLLLAHAAGGLGLAGAPAAAAAAPTRAVLVALLLGGFGIKAGAVLLHLWLPLAHPVAPTPASAVLSGAMIKAGLLGWLRFLPLGNADLPEVGSVVVLAGLAAAFYGVAVGLVQREAKVILAYSSVSQMGFMTLGVGAGLMVASSWTMLLPAVTLYAMHHGLAKGALFLGVGVARTATRGRGWVLGGLALPALALAGAPLTSGMLVKMQLKEALAALPATWSLALAWLLPLAALGTTLLMARFLWIVRNEMRGAPPGPSGLTTPWIVTVAASTTLLWLYAPVPIEAVLAPGTLAAAASPVALGVLAAVAAVRFLPAWRAFIPPGDVLVPIEAGLRALTRRGRSLAVRHAKGVRPAPTREPPRMTASQAERALRSPRANGVALLLLLGLVVALLLFG